MRKALPILFLCVASASQLAGAYSYFQTWNLAYSPIPNATPNGSWANGGQSQAPGSAIYNGAVGGANSNDYEVYTTMSLKASGGTLTTYLRASANALTGAGTYISVELSNIYFDDRGACTAVLSSFQSTNSSVTYLGGTSVACHDGMTTRSVIFGTSLWVFIDNQYVWAGTVSASSGNPGIGHAGSNADGILTASFGTHVTTGPNAIDPATVHTSVSPSAVSASSDVVRMQWTGAADPNGPGTVFYIIYRNGQYCASTDRAAFDDETASLNSSYSYDIYPEDFHGNWGPKITVTASTPPYGYIDPRRTGVHANASYWGGGGEQIDLRSGNVNFALPLIQPKFRTGASVPLGLSYNSQNWVSDGGGVWQFGADVGYGYGWRLSFGSVIPIWRDNFTIDRYLFTDASGAETPLISGSGNSVWTSSPEATYLFYDPTTKVLHFKDGSYWIMGAIASGAEPDAGTLYPTVIADSNGNTITVTYDVGAGVTGQNTSARIVKVNDLRSSNGMCADANWQDCVTYRFLYNTDATPHLTGIHNGSGTPETYAFTYQSVAVVSAFGNATDLTAGLLASFTVPTTTTPYSFQYDTPSSGHSAGEMTRVNFPYGGHLRWDYTSFIYGGGRTLREVSNRYLATDSAGATEWTYPITHDDSGNSSPVTHRTTMVADASGVGAKRWTFYTLSTAPIYWQVGLLSTLDHLTGASGVILKQDALTWTTDAAGNPYIGVKMSTADPGTANQQITRSSQSLDAFGNITQTAVYPLNSTTALKTFNYTYLNASSGSSVCGSLCSQYPANYIYNRLVQATVTTGGVTKTLVQNTYDLTTPATATVSQRIGTSAAKGLVTTSTTPALKTTNTWWDWGVVQSASRSDGTSTTYTTTGTTNYSLPNAITTESYSQTLSYDPFLNLASTTGLNGEQLNFTYDFAGRPVTATSPYGAVTTYSYGTANPFWQSTTGPNGVTKTTLDGLGRAVRVERGDTNGTQSIVDTVYSPCACSPMGKVQKISQPYAPGTATGQLKWSVYSYDGLGRTLSVVQPDGASTTSYQYSGTQTTVTDPAGKWKKLTNDSEGNLVQVVEPDPANQPGGTLNTSYSYDWMNHLTGVSMPRSTGTQTRTFVYDDFGNMTSETNPETGLVTYTYNSVNQLGSSPAAANNQLAKKHDAKGQDTVYSYDTKNRLMSVAYYPNGMGGSVDPCSGMTYSYDYNPFDANYSTFRTNRLAAITYNICGSANPQSLNEQYSYSPAGAVTGKKLSLGNYVNNGSSSSWVYQTKQITYGYDSAGRLSLYSYPAYADAIVWTSPFPYSSIPLTTVIYGRDTMGRLNSMLTSGPRDPNGFDGYVSNIPLVKNVQYDVAGRMTSMQRIASVIPVQYSDPQFGIAYTTESRSYNAQEQLTSINWNSNTSVPNYGYVDPGPDGTIAYQYSATQNNGQITGMTDSLSGDSVVYQYDALSRLSSAVSSGGTNWTQNYGFDGFGNLTSKTTNGTTLSYPADPLTNRISNGNAGSAGMYDANGNMTGAPGTTLTYDVANHVVAANVNGAIEHYFYDAGNRRVYTRTTNGNDVLVLYGAFGEKLSGPTGPSLWFGGRLIWDSGKPVHPDRVSSNRGSGAKYYPYGEERGTATSNDQTKFATYTRDSFSGLDYAVNRWYLPGQGRFGSADMSGTNETPVNPASWNTYSYVHGDPVNGYDPNGLSVCVFTADSNDGCGDDFQPFGADGAMGSSSCKAGYGFVRIPGNLCFELAQTNISDVGSPDPCPGIASTIRDTISGKGMPGGKSLMTRVVQQITGDPAKFDKHQIEIDGYRNRLRNLRRDWKNNDCDDPNDPPYGTNRWIDETSGKKLMQYQNDYIRFVQDLKVGAVAGAASLMGAILAFIESLGGALVPVL